MNRLRILTTCALLLSAVMAHGQTAPKPADAPENAGRRALVTYLNGLAANDEAARRIKMAAIHTRAEAEARQAEVHRTIARLLGSLPARTPLNAKITGQTQADGFRVEKLLFESQPGFYVTALVYVPDAKPAAGRFPAVLMSPGHSPLGKVGDVYFAATFARNGFLVLSMDPLGQGERLQYPDPAKPGTSLAQRPTGEHAEASLQPMLLGDAVARYFIWDTMRAVDYLETRPDVDAKRIGALGCSGGGTVTAMETALDPRIAATVVACYNTTFDALLTTLGPQDGEQSIPGFIAAGLDFADWVELVAPRPYAEISTYSDMFAFSGARATAVESRRFYSLFDAASAGTPTGASSNEHPTEPAIDVDSANTVSPAARFHFITGPGGHGALVPVMPQILGFFLRALAPETDAEHPVLLPAPVRGAAPMLPVAATQVTATGQVATSMPGAATVFSLNRERATLVLHGGLKRALGTSGLRQAIRETTGATAMPNMQPQPALQPQSAPVEITSPAGLTLHGTLSVPAAGARHPAVLMLIAGAFTGAEHAEYDRLAAAGNVVLALTPSPSPAGTDESKASIIGVNYLLDLRAELVGRDLVGIRVDDTIRAVDYLRSLPNVDPAQITATGANHMGLVLLYAGVLDERLTHITVRRVLRSYAALLDVPLPVDIAEDVVPGVLLHYDLPMLRTNLGSRLTETGMRSGGELLQP